MARNVLESLALFLSPFAVLEAMVGRVHQKGERGFENLVDFACVDLERE